MFYKRNLTAYPNPQPAPSATPITRMFGFDRVMVALRRIKLIVGFVIVSEQEVIDDRRIISWRVGSVCDEHCMIVSYNFTHDRDWFTIMDSPTGVVQEPDIETLYERGEDIQGPEGYYTFDDQAVVEILEEIEEAAYTVMV